MQDIIETILLSLELLLEIASFKDIGTINTIKTGHVHQACL
jgi:hypothetical protein